VSEPKPSSGCADCRHVSIYKRPRIMEETGFDDQLMFSDASDDEPVFICKSPTGPFAGSEIGPIAKRRPSDSLDFSEGTCRAWTAPAMAGAERLAELDRLMARFDERNKNKERE